VRKCNSRRNADVLAKHDHWRLGNETKLENAGTTDRRVMLLYASGKSKVESLADKKSHGCIIYCRVLANMEA